MSTSTGAMLAPGWKQPRAFDIVYYAPAAVPIVQGQTFYAHVKVES